MAGKYGSASVTISLEDAPGGTARAMAGYITEIGGVKVTSNLQASTVFGVAWETHTPTGVQKADPITIKGFFDTTATTGPHAVFGTVDDGPQDDGRELIVVFGDSKTFTGDCRLMSYAVMAKVGGLTEYEVSLQPTGTQTWS